ncbi:MAG: hypothetical protein KF729_19470 [Sandaracinaceae bacterium]|nr:hypothetical protein [Sandaracinaceae bacterium]
MQKRVLYAALVCALASSGCIERKGAAVGPNVGYGQEVRIGGGDVSRVDVLFVIDDSGSMAQEQANLAVQIPRLVRDLASPPDRNLDGVPDWNAAEELRIGIVTTDVGMGSVSIPMSGCVPGGDDGTLRGGVFEWRAGDDADAFAARVRDTVAELGIRGCAFEQPLEAAARAVARAPETGFPRADALFALIVVTDEEDCSVDDDDAFFAAMEPSAYNVYCQRNADRLTPVTELLARIRGAREEREFVYAAIAGLPVGLAPDTTPEAILARDDMQHREDGARNPRSIPVCGSDDALGRADPGRRLVELARHVPASVLTTICTDDFGPAISEIGARIGGQIPGVCLVREVPRGLGERVPCTVTVTLPSGDRCAGREGYTLFGLSGEREICELAQVPGGAGEGFYYDPAHESCPQLVITEGARPPVGATVSAECFFPLHRELGELCARGPQCGSGYCDPVTRTCALLPTGGSGATGG